MGIQSHKLRGNGPVTFSHMLELTHTSPVPQHALQVHVNDVCSGTFYHS